MTTQPESSLRLLYLATSPGLSIHQLGGAGTHIRGTLLGLRQVGFEILPLIGDDVFNKSIPIFSSGVKTPARTRSILKRLMPNKLRLFLRDLRTKLYDRKFEKATIALIENFQPEAIYERSAYLSTYGSKLARKYKIPHLLETDGCMIEVINADYGVFSTTLGNLIEKRKLTAADYVVAMNRSAVSMLKRKFNLKNKRFLVKTLGIERSDFTSSESTIQALQQKLKLTGKFVVGFVGAISAYHGVNYLLDAAKCLHEQGNTDVVFLIVGWSKEADRLKNLAQKWNLRNVIFIGKVDKAEIPNYYELMDAGIIPDAEQIMYPIKVLEYGSFEVPPIVPRYPVFEDLLVEDETGFFFTPRDPVSIAQQVRLISLKRDQCEEVGARWQVQVNENFKWKNTVKEIADTLLTSRRSENITHTQ